MTMTCSLRRNDARFFTLAAWLFVVVSGGLWCRVAHAEPRLHVSEDGRFLVREDGSPFFYLSDTAWELFHRLNREEANDYLDDRAKKGFTVIQAVALAEVDGLNTPNAYGHRPLMENDPTRPAVKDGPQNDYWDHVDYVVAQAAERGLFVGLLPTWGDKWNKKWGVGPEIFTPQNAAVYGEWLGRRYRDQPIVWIVGGDRPIENDTHRVIIRAMATGLRRGDEGRHLVTFHPTGGQGSAQWFHEEAWLDFNMRQNGHGVNFEGRYDQTLADYQRKPPKPVIDGEPVYEDHPIAFKAQENGYSLAADVRRPLYWDLFSGACGHTYGHHSVWQMWTPARQPINGPLLPWREAIQQPGAAEMQHGRRLIESRPMLTRIPDNSLIVNDAVPTAIPGAGRLRMVATRDRDGHYAMIYSPAGRPFAVRMDKLTGPQVTAWWYNPRTGEAAKIGDYTNQGKQRFVPPDVGEYLDWVLVLDDASQNYLPPGQTVLVNQE